MKTYSVECFDRQLKIVIAQESFDKIYGNEDIETFSQFKEAIEKAGGYIVE